MKKKQTPPPPKPVSTRAVILIIGDTPLTAEVADLCTRHGYSTIVHPPAPSPRGSSKKSPTLASIGAQIRKASLVVETTNDDPEKKRKNLEAIDAQLPAEGLILSTSAAITATEQASWIAGRHRLVGIGWLPGLTDAGCAELAPTVFTPTSSVEVAARFLGSLGKSSEVVQDRVGLVAPRILCRLINEAAFAVGEDAASPTDVDRAMTLALGHGKGPFEWADRLGLSTVLTVLTALQQEYGSERYRIAPLLRQMAFAGEWWKNK